MTRKNLKQLEQIFQDLNNASSFAEVHSLHTRLKMMHNSINQPKRREELAQLVAKCDKLAKQRLREFRILLKSPEPRTNNSRNKTTTPVQSHGPTTLAKSLSTGNFASKHSHHNHNIPESDQEAASRSSSQADMIPLSSKIKDKKSQQNGGSKQQQVQLTQLSENLKELKADYAREVQKKRKLKDKVEELEKSNCRKDQQIEELKRKLDRISEQLEDLEKTQQKDPGVYTKSSFRGTEGQGYEVEGDSQSQAIQKEKVMLKYEDKLRKKNQTVEQLRHNIVELEAEVKHLKIQNSLITTKSNERIDELKRLFDSTTLKFQNSIKEKEELRKQNQELRFQNSAYADELERLAAEKAIYKHNLDKQYNLLREELMRKDKEEKYLKNTLQPKIHQEKADKIILLERLEESDKTIAKFKEANHTLEMENKHLKDEINKLEDRLSKAEDRINQKKQKNAELKREVDKWKEESFASQAVHKTLQEESFRRTEQTQLQNRSVERKLKALEGIKNLIRKYPR